LQLYDDLNQPSGRPLFGRFAELYGDLRDEVVKGGSQPSLEETDHPGSEDWLTLVAVADTEARLRKILDDTPVTRKIPNTSHSSRRVQVEVHVDSTRLSLGGRTVIASGPIVSVKPGSPRIDVVHVKVFDGDSKMDDDHPHVDEFDGGSIALTSKV
jgi:hypothetical protein